MVTRNPVLISAYQSFATANAIGEWASIRQRLLTGDRRIASRDEHDKILAAIRNRDSGEPLWKLCASTCNTLRPHYSGLGRRTCRRTVSFRFTAANDCGGIEPINLIG